jgi:hypothetical protein
MELKIRLEAEMEHGDLIPAGDVLADALESLAKTLRDAPLFVPNDVIDVPRGKLAYSVMQSGGTRTN